MKSYLSLAEKNSRTKKNTPEKSLQFTRVKESNKTGILEFSLELEWAKAQASSRNALLKTVTTP